MKQSSSQYRSSLTIIPDFLFVLYAGLAFYSLYLDNNDSLPRLEYERISVFVVCGALFVWFSIWKNVDHTKTFAKYLPPIIIGLLLAGIILRGFAIFLRLSFSP